VSGDGPRQLSFDLPLDPRYGREDFLVGPANEAAYERIEAWPDWPHHALVLVGPAGAGKSHLAAIWAERAHAWTIEANAVSAGSVAHLVSNGALVIEDADRAGSRDEAALFHLLNGLAERRAPVVLTARQPVEGWSLATRDLLSRLRLAPAVAIEPPDEALLAAVLVKLFVDRQLVVDLSVVETLAPRIGRSIARARGVVADLDREALSRGRRITRPMALAVLERHASVMRPGDDEPDDEAGA
jgi:chromosomal replication initiation ATPase DnaA